VTENRTTSSRRGDEVARFTGVELAQHWILLVTLTVLALTGLALFAHDTWIGRTLIALEGGIETRGIIHRVAAIVLVALVTWHLLYVLFTDRGHRQLMEMRLSTDDVRAVGLLVGYYLGRRTELPDFGRFSPMQKLQYWGAGLGSFLMIITGFVLWFHTQAMAVAPKWVIDVTTIVHGYEGLILFVLLFGWHLYIVHLSPGNFPMQRTFLSGRISRERLWTEHRLEYRELFGDQPPGSSQGDAERRAPQ
jgi:formate dehydrogenase subunit gamma